MRARNIAAVLVFVASFVGTVSADAQPKPIPVKIAWQPAFIPHLYVGRDLKMFEKAGLIPEYVKFIAGPPMLAALKSGSVDLAYMGVNPALAGLSQGLDIKVILIENDDLLVNGLVVRKGSGIEKVADIRGKRIGVTKGSSSYYGLKKAIAGAGLSESDVNILDMALPSWIPAFTKGDVDGLFVWPPWLYKVEAEGGKVIATLKGVGITLAQGIWVARSDWLEKNSEATQRFVHAFDLVTKTLKQDPSLGIRAVAETVEISQEMAKRLYTDQVMPTLEQMADPTYENSLVSDSGFAKGV